MICIQLKYHVTKRLAGSSVLVAKSTLSMRGFRVFLLGTMLAACMAASAQTTTNHPPFVAIVTPTNGSVFRALDDIFLMAQASDRDGDVVEVSFFANQRYIGGVTNPPPDMSPLPPWRIHWNDVAADRYSLQARATDKAGAMAWSAPVSIHVRGIGEFELPRVDRLHPRA
jgi:hypothetical protein